MKKRGSKQKDLYVLSPEDREFFGRVSEAAFMNPFSEELVVITRLIPNYSPEDHPNEHSLWTLGLILKDRIDRLKQRGSFTGRFVLPVMLRCHCCSKLTSTHQRIALGIGVIG
jgi:hypothetical protein